eukprot:gene21913-26867_t
MTRTKKRTFKLIVSLGLAAAMASAWAFPSKPIRVVMGFPAGGPLDQHARLLTDRLQLSDAFKSVMNQPDIRQRMVAQGADPAYLGADDFAKFLTTEMPRWAAVGTRRVRHLSQVIGRGTSRPWCFVKKRRGLGPPTSAIPSTPSGGLGKAKHPQDN